MDKLRFSVLSGILFFLSFLAYSQKNTIKVHPVFETTGVFLGESQPLRDLLPVEDLEKAQQLFMDAKQKRKELEFERNPEMKQRRYPFLETALPKGPDPLLQNEQGKNKSVTTTLIHNFDGQSGSAYPLDCNGTVGPNHFMQTINLTYTIYNKSTEAKVAGPTNLNTIFSGVTGSNCNDGDPVILYDENANRWFFAEFSLCGSNDYMLVAVSTTSDPTGTWYRYSFDVDDVPDYMKFGVWRDGYYMATNNTSGKDVYVFQRDVILSGGSNPKMVGFDNPYRPNSGFHCIMPVDNDWDFAPSGKPGIFVTINDDAWGGSDQLWIYELQVNWNNTSSSTFTRTQTISVPAFSSYFGSTTWDDITQPGTSQKLDGIPTVLMFRAQYVNFGTEERIVCYHTVNVGSNRAGLRWYELVRPSGSSTWTIRQNGTYAPNDGLNRWCGSIAINSNKQIALMYSVTGGTNVYPGIRICGQSAAANAAANGTLDIPETVVVNGGTYQSGANRWGDYTQLSVDPVDKTTFWGTTQYMKNSTSTKYTRIVAFKFNESLNLPPVADFIGTPTTVIQGGTVSFTDQSTNNPTSWQWSFPGGTPASSTQQNPTVIYNTPGTYNVTLIVTNQYGSDTITKTNYITVLPPSSGFSLDFEACTDWSTDFSPWISLDQDGKATYGSVDCDFPGEGTAFGFMAFNPSLAGCFSTHGGQRCGVAICPSDGSQADNWLISSAIPMQTGGSISFWVLSPKPGTWGNETYDVLVSTTNTQPSSFTTIASNEVAPSTWTQKTYSLSAYNNQTIYVAIRHRSIDKFMLFIDDISINPGTSLTLPVASFTPSSTSICQNGNIVFTNTSTNATSYMWTFEGGDPATSTSSNVSVTYSTPGTYNVTLIATNANGSDTATATITVHPNPQISIQVSSPQVCYGQSVTLTASGAQSYTWSNGIINGVAFVPNATTTYTVTGTDANSCTSTAQQTIIVRPLPNVTISATSTSVCSGQSVTLTANGAQSYVWNNNVVNGIPFTPTSTNTYTVTGTDVYGCSNTASVNITVNPLPNISISASSNPVCEGDLLTLTASGAQTYIWNNGVQNGVPFTPQGPATYSVTGTDVNGCTGTAQITVDVIPSYTLSATVTNVSTYGGSDGAIDLTISGGVTPYIIQWSNGATVEDLTNIPAGTYTVNVTNSFGCVTSLTVVVNEPPLSIVEVDSNTRLAIYPNPTQSDVILAIRSNYQLGNLVVELYNMIGMKVKEWHYNLNSKSLDESLSLNNLSKGNYLIKVYLRNEIYTLMIIKN